MRGADLAGENGVAMGTSRSNMTERQYIQRTMNMTDIQGFDPNKEAIAKSL